MESLISSLLSFVGMPLLFFGVMLLLIVRRGFQVYQLLKDGVDATGIVVRKVKFGTPGRTFRLRYEYTDPQGRKHSHRSNVDEDVYNAYDVGSPFPIVYSRSKPHISAPKYIVDLSRQAKEKSQRAATR